MKKDGDAMKKDGDAMKQGDAMKKETPTPTKPQFLRLSSEQCSSIDYLPVKPNQLALCK